MGTWDARMYPFGVDRGDRKGAADDVRAGVRPLHSTLRRESRSHGEGSGSGTQPAKENMMQWE